MSIEVCLTNSYHTLYIHIYINSTWKHFLPSFSCDTLFKLLTKKCSSLYFRCTTFTEPNFVGSFDIGDYVYFFFRETAVEYINCGKAVYSRIARVCKKDIGGKNILSQNWATYLKARLNCSISGEFPFYFNEIQAVYQLPSDKTKFYATFTTSTNGLVGSAVCSFDINEIQGAFNGM